MYRFFIYRLIYLCTIYLLFLSIVFIYIYRFYHCLYVYRVVVEKRTNIVRLLERLARALFCSGRWSQRSAARKNSRKRRCKRFFHAPRIARL
jgi:hypothetical protein